MNEQTAQIVSTWTGFVAPFASGVLGALAGAILTWLTAGRKLLRERAAERRLEWLEGMHDSLVAVITPLAESYAAAITKPANYSKVIENLQKVFPAFESAHAQGMRAGLFASPHAVAAIREAFEYLEEGGLKIITLEEAQSRGIGAVAERVETILDTFRTARQDIVQDTRRHLGLEQLPRGIRTTRDNAVRMGLLPPT